MCTQNNYSTSDQVRAVTIIQIYSVTELFEFLYEKTNGLFLCAQGTHFSDPHLSVIVHIKVKVKNLILRSILFDH